MTNEKCPYCSCDLMRIQLSTNPPIKAWLCCSCGKQFFDEVLKVYKNKSTGEHDDEAREKDLDMAYLRGYKHCILEIKQLLKKMEERYES